MCELEVHVQLRIWERRRTAILFTPLAVVSCRELVLPAVADFDELGV
jgi:hypothetical protein